MAFQDASSTLTGCANSWIVPGTVTTSKISLPNAPAFTGNLSSLQNDAGFLVAQGAGNVYTGNSQAVSFGNTTATRLNLPLASNFQGQLSTLQNDALFTSTNTTVQFSNVTANKVAVTGNSGVVTGVIENSAGSGPLTYNGPVSQGHSWTMGSSGMLFTPSFGNGLIPYPSSTYSLGGSVNAWKNLYLSGVLTIPRRVAWTNITPASASISGSSSSYFPAQYCQDELGYVRCRGGVVSTSTANPQTLFTLPSGLCPNYAVVFTIPVFSQNMTYYLINTLTVNTNGTVVSALTNYSPSTYTSPTTFLLDCVNFALT